MCGFRACTPADTKLYPPRSSVQLGVMMQPPGRSSEASSHLQAGLPTIITGITTHSVLQRAARTLERPHVDISGAPLLLHTSYLHLWQFTGCHVPYVQYCHRRTACLMGVALLDNGIVHSQTCSCRSLQHVLCSITGPHVCPVPSPHPSQLSSSWMRAGRTLLLHGLPDPLAVHKQAEGGRGESAQRWCLACCLSLDTYIHTQAHTWSMIS